MFNSIFKNSIKSEFKRLINKKEFFIIISICILIGISTTLSKIFIYDEKLAFRSYMFGNAPMAAVVSMINGVTIYGSIYSWIIMPIFIAVICGDSFCIEQNLGCHQLFLIRESRKDYFISKAIAVSVISFFIAILPFVISEILSVIAFPLNNNVVDTLSFSAYNNLNLELYGYPLFRNLYLNYRYLNNFIIILFNGIVGINIGLFTYAITLNFKFKRTLICAISSSIYIITTFILGNINDSFFLFDYLASLLATKINIMFFVLFNLIISTSCVLCIRNKITKNKDIF